MNDIDTSSYELGAICPKLRADLAFRRQQFGGEPCYVLEDAKRSQFFRIGVPEYTFLSLLDGRTSITDGVAETARQLGPAAITESQAGAFCAWLIDNSLATTVQSHSSSRLIDDASRQADKRRREWLNPVMLKFPFGSPDAILSGLNPLMAWLFGPLGCGLWLLAIVFGGYAIFANSDKLAEASGGVLSPDNWIWLSLSWLVLKSIHELAHGLVCLRYGARSRDAGLLFLLFVPLPYVDVTASWRFASKWKRIYVAAAGMYAELFVAAIAGLVWANSTSDFVQHHAFNVLLTAGFVTLMFNINPLMKFDGYYILSDALELPNLATHGQHDLMYLCRRWLLGISAARPEWPEGRALVIRCYGVAAFVWRMLICVSLITAAELLYHGAGIVLAALAVVLWVIVPAVRFVRYLICSDPVNPPNRIRFAAIAATAMMCGYGGWNHFPWVERIRFPAMVDYNPVSSVRVAASGFVRDVRVGSGDEVAAGDTLFVLENVELTTQVEDLKLAIEKSRLLATGYHRSGRQAAFQVELANEKALSSSLAELQLVADQLVVKAPASGIVLSRNLQQLEGSWASAGKELIVLGEPSQRSVQFLVSQSDIDTMKSLNGDQVRVHIWGSGNLDMAGRVTDVEPRGTSVLKHPALSAAAGGPLAVKAMTQNSARTPQRGASNNSAGEWQLLTPHFCGHVQLAEGSLQQFGTGQRGYVEFRAQRGTVGQVIETAIARALAKHRLLN